MFAIPTQDHPSNLDPTAVCVSGAREDRLIFRVMGGFVACVGDSMALEGLFPTEGAARSAIQQYLRGQALAALPNRRKR